MNKKLIEARDNIIESAGRTTQGFGLGRIIGQLYALLFFSPSPLSLDDMAEALKISKGSASTNIRELEKWGAVRKVWIKGERRDYYEAEVDLFRIVWNGFLPFLKQKLNSSLLAADESRAMLNAKETFEIPDGIMADFYLKRLELIGKAQSKLSLLLKLPGI